MGASGKVFLIHSVGIHLNALSMIHSSQWKAFEAQTVGGLLALKATFTIYRAEKEVTVSCSARE
jgi:hypothetical protein